MSARWLFSALSPAGKHARLSVFIFHRVRPERDPLFPREPDAVQFEQQMRWVSRWFTVLPLPEAVERLQAGSLPSRVAAVTFYDGYADNYTVALTILKRVGLPATFFIATGFLDGGRMWNDTVIEAVRRSTTHSLDLPSLGLSAIPVDALEAKQSAIGQLLSRLKYLPPEERDVQVAQVARASGVKLPTDLMLTSDQLLALSTAGMTIGAHTVSHPILANLNEDAARHEIETSKARLEDLIGRRVSLFAYPNGKPDQDYRGAHVALVRAAGFAAAFSTSKGVASASTDLFQLPRFTPWDRSAPRWAYRLAGNLRAGEPAVAVS